MGFDAKHEADLEWLLVVLSTLNPNHRYFAKDYVPSLQETRKNPIATISHKNFEEEFDLADEEFFKDLPKDDESELKINFKKTK